MATNEQATNEQATNEQANEQATPSNEEILQALQARIEQLEQQVQRAQVQQPAGQLGTKKPSKLQFGPAFTFEGSHDENEIDEWLSKIEGLIRVNDKVRGEKVDDEEKILIAEQHLSGAALRQYILKGREQPFESFDSLVSWLRDYYTPKDILAKYRYAYKSIRQEDDETIDQYHLRFTELVSRMDVRPDPSLQVSDFVFGLHHTFSKTLAQYGDMSDFKNVKLGDVVDRLKRNQRMTGTRKNIQEHRHSSNSKPYPKSKPKLDSKSKKKVPLTSEQKRRLELLIQRGGGEYISKEIYENPEWFQFARERKVCARCAAAGHIAKECTAEPKQSRGQTGGSRSQLHAMIPDVDSAMDADRDYLCTLADNIPLALFPCSIQDAYGIALGDFGSTRNWISRRYAKRAKLQIHNSPIKVVDLPNGQKMQVYGAVELELSMSEWKGKVHAWVLDMHNDFDIVLGLQWFQEWEPEINWKTLELTVETTTGKKHIRRLPTIGNVEDIEPVSDVDIAEFNLISERELKRIFKKGDKVQSVLYFVRESAWGSDESGESLNTIGTESELDNLPATEDAELRTVIQEYQDVFREGLPDGLPPQRDIDHEINTGNELPSNRQAYPLSVVQLEEQTKQIGVLLKRRLIRESTSPWGAPVLFVRKPRTEEWRMCIDYRALNNKTIKNAYPLPRIQDCIDRLGKATHCTTLDLTSGYHQIRIAPKDIEKTAFNTRYGKYEFLVMSFGLTNAPATFQMLMNQILRPYIDKFVLVYLDDILIYSNSTEEHRKHLRLVLDVLRKHKLYVRPRKCTIDQPEVEFCGHIVGGGIVKVLDQKVKVIREWPVPKNVHEVRQFYGLANYYRRFVRNFGQIGAPLAALFKQENGDKRKNRPIIWNTSHQFAFERLKQALTNAPVLQQPDPMKPYTIETDASDFAIGYVLMQQGDDGLMHPVAFDGRKLRGAELRYPTHEKELLAIKEAVVKWKHYIENNHTTTILTDHESLKYMNSVSKPSKRLARWIDEFQGYDLDIRYRRGRDAVVPDALSRRPDYFNYIANEKDNYISYIKQFLIDGTLPNEAEKRGQVMHHVDDFMLDEDQGLLRKLRNGERVPYIEPLFRGDFMQSLHHQFGHLSYASIANAIESRGWWPAMESDVRRFIATCPNCQIAQRQRVDQEREQHQLLTDPFIQPFQRWGIDLIGVLPKTAKGNRWIITAIDYATGWPVAKAVPRATEEVIADFLYEEIYMHYGAPQELFSDGGKNLWSGVVQAYLKKIGTEHKGSSPYHPRTNGKVERLNGILGEMITKLLMGKPTKLWDLYLDTALFACRIRTNTTTKTSPFYLLYGRQPRLHADRSHALPSDATPADHEQRFRLLSSVRLEAARATHERALRDRNARNAIVTPHSLSEGDWVLVRHEDPQKFESKWFGPYQVVQRMLLGTYRLQDPNGHELQALVHGNRLIKANIRTTEELRKLWASPATKDALRRRNIQTELVPSEPENTRILEKYLFDLGEDEPDPGEDQGDIIVPDGDLVQGPIEEGGANQGDVEIDVEIDVEQGGQDQVHAPKRRLLDEIIVAELPRAKRRRNVQVET